MIKQKCDMELYLRNGCHVNMKTREVTGLLLYKGTGPGSE